MPKQKKSILLSKSRIMRGIQCAKSLYLTLKHPELEAPVSASQQALFTQGNEVGLLAQRGFPGGITITAPYYDTNLAVDQTESAIKQGANNIYEATFSSNGVAAKIDILHRDSPENKWSIVEVKSSTSVKNEHITDVAIQYHVMNNANIQVENVFLMHINNKVVAPNLDNLFIQVPITLEVEGMQSAIKDKITALREVITLDEAPQIDIGPHCDEPHECPFKAHCWKHIPDKSIFEIPLIGKKSWEWYKSGVVEISDPRFVPTASQLNRVNAVRTSTRWVDDSIIKKELEKWVWPLFFLDFETIAFAIPKYDGTKPFEQIPFQFSCLIQKNPEGEIKEYSFIHDSSSDPRPLLIERLLEALEGTGSIVAYNMGFEAGCIERLASYSSQHSNKLLSARARLVDPLPIFRSAVYDPGFKGSFSIKSVSPAILGKDRSYAGMEISNGEEAQRGFLKLIEMLPNDKKRKELLSSMLAYCRKDTNEMLDLVCWLYSSR